MQPQIILVVDRGCSQRELILEALKCLTDIVLVDSVPEAEDFDFRLTVNPEIGRFHLAAESNLSYGPQINRKKGKASRW